MNRYFRCTYLVTIFWMSLSYISFSQSSQDAAVELHATVQEDPPLITLHWKTNATATQYTVHRKLKTGSNWGAALVTVAGDEMTFTDSTVAKGISYEYRVIRNASNYSGVGYINAGIEIPLVENRGIIILLVEASLLDSMAAEIDRFIMDLEGDGWQVKLTSASRNAKASDVKTQLKDIYNESAARTKALCILGRIPVPYSGDLYPDGHPDHEGAWPADVYYGEMNGLWTDNQVNVTVANDERHYNQPGDGKFDQTLIPNDVELQVGRIDFANMPAFAASEITLLRNYLNKNHAYRHKMFQPVYRAIIDDNFGYLNGEAFASTGWKNFGPLVHPDSVRTDDYFTALATQSHLWSYGCGGGWYQGAGGVGSTGDFANADLQSVFTLLFGSYFGDWDSQNNFLRAPLAQGLTLTNAWSGRPHWILHHMGLGETIGFGARTTQNNNALYTFNYGGRFIHIALMGDPTLRNDVIAPVSELSVVPTTTGSMISWKPSAETVAGYHVYLRSSEDDEFLRINDELITTTSYEDPCVLSAGTHTYMVRAVRLITSYSGSYYAASQGVQMSIEHPGAPVPEAYATWIQAGTEVFFQNESMLADSVEWDFGDGFSSTEDNPSHIFGDGVFTVSLIAYGACANDTFTVELSILSGTEAIVNDPSFSITPNPGKGIFEISFPPAIMPGAAFYIYSSAGEIVLKGKMQTNDHKLDLSDLPAGVYRLVIGQDNRHYTNTLVIQQ